MKEGSLGAPVRRVIPWQDDSFYDEQEINAGLRRIFDICHGCRRCFNLCGSFPRLFDLVDATESGEMEDVSSADFKSVVDACTLCDMCFMTKCPYVPPHEFDLDFPHLMLRYRAAEFRRGEVATASKQMTRIDRNAKMGCRMKGAANWATSRKNKAVRATLEGVLGIHRDAALPPYCAKTFGERAANSPFEINKSAPAFGRKAVIYATCFSQYYDPDIGMAALGVLAKNGVEAEVVHPACCAMPSFEQGDIKAVAVAAKKVSAEFGEWIDKGYDVISMTPSCSLMMKFEWPLILPEDVCVERLSRATFDLSEYVAGIAEKEGLAEGLQGIEGGISLHIACHARAQNMGQKANDLLKHLPGAEVSVVERCSGHGGIWGVMKDNFDVALKVGKPVARKVAQSSSSYVVSECPLAREHIVQGIEALDEDVSEIIPLSHPIQLIAKAYGLIESGG
jgi:glycerol-3-phosphate dehydrogenase subunit C